MKKNIILFIASFLWCTALVAQDVIVRKDGSTIISKVLEVNQSDVKYKKHSNLNGPTYTINKSDILSINYENGEKEKYDNDSAPIVAESKQVSGGVAKPESDNQLVINKYNNLSARFSIDGTQKKSKASYWAGILAVDTSSIMSSKYLVASLVQSTSCLLNGTWTHPWPFNGHYMIELKNKSTQTIYVDLGNTFRVDEDGQYKVYYDTKQTTIGHNSGSGVSLNIGSVSNVLGIGGAVGTLANGVSVGSGKGHSTSTTYTKQRIVAIPPQATMVIERCEWEHVKGAALYKEENCVYKSYCEGFNYYRLGHVIHENEEQHFTFDDSPCKYMYTITYSLSETFDKWEALRINVYASLLCGGIKIYHRNFEKIKEKVINYTPSTIIIGGERTW